MIGGGDVSRGIAIIGMTTAARLLLDAADLIRRDEAAALDMLADAMSCVEQAMRVATGNPGS